MFLVAKIYDSGQMAVIMIEKHASGYQMVIKALECHVYTTALVIKLLPHASIFFKALLVV